LATKLDLTGGTMSGAINMGSQKITNLGVPSAAADAVTKAYVDGLAAPQGGLVPWAELRALADTTATNDAHWGDTWEARAAGHMIRGVAACLSATASDNDLDVSTFGINCWCRVSSVNGIETFGPWVFSSQFGSHSNCYAACAIYCGGCVRNGNYGSCHRSELFAAP
jgi:hypothetical protein